MTKQDAYSAVTARIIEALEAGVVPWHKPWRSFAGNAPRSMSTGKAYQGVNVWTLGATAMMRGYSSPYWITFKQAKERGGSVRKGEKGSPVVFWKFLDKKDPATGEVDGKIPLLRYFTVFNVEQCDGIEAPAIEALPEREPIEACEAIARGYIDGPTVNHGGDRAYYSPALDMIGMPRIGQFDTTEHYYGTLFHELAHSTGHADRLARKSLVHPAAFGSEDYSREELVAEMAAAFLCGEAGIEVNVVHHASYIGSWLKALQDDNRLVVQAGAAAHKAAALILGDTFAAQEGDADTASPDPRSLSKLERDSPNGKALLLNAKVSPRPLVKTPRVRRGSVTHLGGNHHERQDSYVRVRRHDPAQRGDDRQHVGPQRARVDHPCAHRARARERVRHLEMLTSG